MVWAERQSAQTACSPDDFDTRSAGVHKEERIMMLPTSAVVAAIVVATGLLVSCSTAPATTTERDELSQKATAERRVVQARSRNRGARQEESWVRFLSRDRQGRSGRRRGLWPGGSGLQQGQHIGYADMTQGSIRLGGRPNLQRAHQCSRTRRPWSASKRISSTSRRRLHDGDCKQPREHPFIDGVAVFIRPRLTASPPWRRPWPSAGRVVGEVIATP